MSEDRLVTIIGWVATLTAVCMYFSYIPQIIDNLHGSKGNPIQPFAASINSLLWVTYGLKRKDYPLVAANSSGIIFGIVAAVTAL